MTRVRLTEVVLQGVPDLLKGADDASVQVSLRGGGVTSVYQDDTSGLTWVNPLTTRDGRIEPNEQLGGIAWLEPGSYDLIVTSGTQIATSPFEAVVGGDAADVSGLQTRVDDIESSAYWDQGDQQNYISLSTEGRLLDLTLGTAAAPDRTANPPMKISRLSDHRAADVAPGAPDEQLTALLVINAGTATTEKQPTAIKGISKTKATSSLADACGVAGSGYMQAGSAGAGEGGFFAARMDSADVGCRIYGIEVQVQNASGSDVAYSNGFGRAAGIVISAGGSALYKNCDSAIKVVRTANDSGQFEVGLAFPSGPGAGAAITAAAIRDDSSAPVSLDVNGTHTNGIDFSGGTYTDAAILFQNGSAERAIKFGASGPNLYGADSTHLKTDNAMRAQSFKATGTGGATFFEAPEQTSDPAAPAANTGRLFFKDNGSGKTQLCVRFNTGATLVIATEP